MQDSKLSIPLEKFLPLICGDNPELNEDVIRGLREILGKNAVGSLADMRAVIMALDQQKMSTPMQIRFTPDDIGFADVNGINYPVDRHDAAVSIQGIQSGTYERHLLSCFERLCRPGSVVFDIGANVGFHSVLFSRLVGEKGHVYAFEPNSENCRLILLTAEKCGVSNLSLLPIALSDQRGWAYFTRYVGSNGGFVSDEFVSLLGYGTVVPTFTLDELSMPNVDVIKADVEGAEYKMLRGGAALLARARPAIVCEFSLRMTEIVSGANPADFLDWINAMDYGIYILDRKSDAMLPVDSNNDLVDNWGDYYLRIEDLLFLPREKSSLIEAA